VGCLEESLHNGVVLRAVVLIARGCGGAGRRTFTFDPASASVPPVVSPGLPGTPATERNAGRGSRGCSPAAPSSAISSRDEPPSSPRRLARRRWAGAWSRTRLSPAPADSVNETRDHRSAASGSSDAAQL